MFQLNHHGSEDISIAINEENCAACHVPLSRPGTLSTKQWRLPDVQDTTRARGMPKDPPTRNEFKNPLENIRCNILPTNASLAVAPKLAQTFDRPAELRAPVSRRRLRRMLFGCVFLNGCGHTPVQVGKRGCEVGSLFHLPPLYINSLLITESPVGPRHTANYNAPSHLRHLLIATLPPGQ